MLSRSQKTATRVRGLGFREVKGLVELRDVIWGFELRILWRNRENIAGVFKLTERERMEIKPVPDPDRIYRIWFCRFCRGVVQTVMPEVELRNKTSLNKNITIPRTLFSKCL